MDLIFTKVRQTLLFVRREREEKTTPPGGTGDVVPLSGRGKPETGQEFGPENGLFRSG